MGKTRDAFIALARDEIGYKEGPKSNETKYAAYLDKLKFFNTAKQFVEWCSTFIHYLAVILLGGGTAGKNAVIKLFGENSKDNCACGVKFFWDYLVAMGYRVDKDKGQPGDIIFFNTKKAKCGHVGMIETADDKYGTIEGNKSNKVACGSYVKNSSTIYGVCHIPWEKFDPKEEPTPAPQEPAEPVEEPQPAEPEKPTEPATPAPVKKTVEELAREVIQGKWGNGEDRVKKLTAAGYSYSEVQARVNEILGVKGKKYTVDVRADSYLNVRVAPNSEIKVGKLHRGDEVTVYEERNGWGRIGTAKWVSMTYLK